MKFHLGNCVTNYLKKAGIKKSELARRIDYSPQQLNQVLKRSSFDAALLCKISNATGYDFFYHYSIGLQVTGRVATAELTEVIAEVISDIRIMKQHNAYLRELMGLYTPEQRIKDVRKNKPMASKMNKSLISRTPYSRSKNKITNR